MSREGAGTGIHDTGGSQRIVAMLVNQYKNRIKRERKVLSAPYSTLDDAVLQPKRARGTSGRRRRFEVLEGVMMCVMGKKSSSWTLNER